jgi:intracellular multiplication protein IcmJ
LVKIQPYRSLLVQFSNVVLLPLTLGVRSISGAEKGKASPQKLPTEKIFRRDDYSCRFCGFHARQYQRVVPCADAGSPPFATACIFCEACLNLERAGVSGAGLLLWLPEVTQVDLNHLARAIYVAQAGKDSLAKLATRALDALTMRRAEAKKRLGSDDPLLLATVLKESLNEEERKAAVAKLDGIRLLPSEKYIVRGQKGDANHFPQIVKYWASSSGPFGDWPTGKWQETFQNAMASTGRA